MTLLGRNAEITVEKFGKADWNSLEAIFAESTYREVGTGRTLQGRAIIDALRDWKTAMPDLTGTVTNTIATGNTVVLEITWEGHQTGPLLTPNGEIPPSGKQRTTSAAWIFEYAGNHLKESRHYFDMLTFVHQTAAA